MPNEVGNKNILASQLESAKSPDELAELWADYLATMIRGDAPLGDGYVDARYGTLLNNLTQITGDRDQKMQQVTVAVMNFGALLKKAMDQRGLSIEQIKDWRYKHYPSTEKK